MTRKSGWKSKTRRPKKSKPCMKKVKHKIITFLPQQSHITLFNMNSLSLGIASINSRAIVIRRANRINKLPISTAMCNLNDNGDDDQEDVSKVIFENYKMIQMNNWNYSQDAKGFDMQQRRFFHETSKLESASVVMSMAAIAVGAKAGQYGLRAYKDWKENQPAEEPVENMNKSQSETDSKQQQVKDKQSTSKSSAKSGVKRENVFAKFFSASVGSKYYEGGFEENMTRREAALILGVRESASAKRIKDAHRKILILNHPDRGGSTYMATKINEAKEMLLKGKE